MAATSHPGGPHRRGSRRRTAAVSAARAVSAVTAVLLVVALGLFGLRGADQTQLAITDHEGAGADVFDRASTTLPPGQAPAPTPPPAPAPVALSIPDQQQAAGTDAGSVSPVVADDALVVPDGQAGAPPPDGTEASLAPAPPTRQPTTPVGPGEGGTPRERFESRFPAHAAAAQDAGDPASSRWAVLVGVNEHTGSTRDNIGSRQDAESLYTHLMDLGWADDHVLLLTDELATRESIVEAVAWLARKTDDASVAVFSYSGHAKQWPGQDMDGDGEVPDEALWPTDNQHIVDGDFVDMMDDVEAGRLWLNFMACEGAGFLDPGLAREGRVVTYSSAEVEKSYEDPSVGHSVWGWNLTVQGLRLGEADSNGDGEVTVQEAATYAIPRAAERTRGQRYGAQNGGMVDQSRGAFSLTIPSPDGSGD